MALCASGAMSLGGSTVGRSVNCELSCSGTAAICMNRADVRCLAKRSSGAICMADFYDKCAPPTSLGQSYCGGYYTGTICAASTCYYLIVAPNASGCAWCQWKTTWSLSGVCNNADQGVNGFNNTYSHLANAAHPAGNFTATRTIGGYTDWYLPAASELTVMQGLSARCSMPPGEGYTSNYYWSSTEDGCYTVVVRQIIGNQSTGVKTQKCDFRAIRRQPV